MATLYEIYQDPTYFLILIILLSIWNLIWNGIALWHSARNKQKEWFIFLLILNTIGILPIIYLIFFRQKNKKEDITNVRVVASSRKRSKVKSFSKPNRK